MKKYANKILIVMIVVVVVCVIVMLYEALSMVALAM